MFTAFGCLWGLSIAGTAFGAKPPKDDVVITDKAREHFKAGVAYIDDPSGPKYEEAYQEFHLAYAQSPTYRIHTNIGLCALNLERDGEAIASYELYLSKASAEEISKDKRALMERDIAMLKASLVRLNLTASPATLILSDERLPSKGSPITNRYELSGGSLALGIHPGHHRITATADGFEPQTWEFDAPSASNHTHEFKLKPVGATAAPTAAQPSTPAHQEVTEPPAVPQTRKTPTLVYVGAAATGVFAIGATVTGLLASSKKSDYDTANSTGNQQDKARDLRDSFKAYALITDIGIGAAVLSAGATAILYFTAPRSTPESQHTARNWSVVPAFAPERAGLSVLGKF